MDKRPVYPGAIPLDLDWLTPQRNTEIALGFLMQAAFGTTTLIDGLSVVPTSPASMAVKVGAGSIISLTTVDTVASGFGSLTYDGTTPLVKIGVNTGSTTMATLTVPGTPGQSQNWLVEAQFIEADGSAIALPFYNATNPTIPYTGPSNTGTASNTARTNRVQFQWKGGTAAATGTQNTPTPDAGWVGVAIVTLTNGQSSIASGDITPYSLAPYVPTKLAQTRKKLTGNLNIYVAATGGSDTANSGLSASSPFATLQKAWNYAITNVDMNGYNIVVNVANGTYTSGLIAAGMPVGYGNGNYIAFTGNTTTPSNCVIQTSNQHCIASYNGASVNIAGFKLTSSGTLGGSPASCLVASQGSISLTGAMDFGACPGQHVWASQAGVISNSSNYTISGGATHHYAAQAGSIINFSNMTVTVTGTPAFSTAFAFAALCGVTQVVSATYSGSATGARYLSSSGGAISVNGGGATYFPGSVAGSATTGYYG